MSIDLKASPCGDSLALREASHRIKNDLQLLSSWVAMAGRRNLTPEKIVSETIARIQIIARLHGSLAGSRTGCVAMNAELSDLARDMSDLNGCAERHIRIYVVAGAQRLSATQARLVLVLAHELIANALRHAFGPKGGDVVDDLNQRHSMQVLSVSHDGGSQAAPSSEGEGGRIVNGIVRALGGSLAAQPSAPSGLRVEVSWPADKRVAAVLAKDPVEGYAKTAPAVLNELQRAA